VLGVKLDDHVGRLRLVRREAGQIRIGPVGQVDDRPVCAPSSVGSTTLRPLPSRKKV